MTYRFPALLLSLSLGCSSPSASVDAGSDAASLEDTGTPADTGAVDAGRDAEAGDACCADDAGEDPCAGGACDPCDTGLALADDDAMNAARAMGVCSGLVNASWTLPDGAPPPSDLDFPLGHGLLDAFGAAVTPLEGARLLAISSGTARRPTDPGFLDPAGLDKGYESGPPSGFPYEAPACPGVVSGPAHDGIALTLTLDVPAGANGFRMLVKQYAREWPSYVCASYSDVAAVLVSPPGAGAPTSGEVTQDALGNPLSSSSSFIDVCSCAGGPPCVAAGHSYACTLGNGDLAGTGFDLTPGQGAATPWLEVRVPATPGERVQVVVTVWDSGDGLFDSTMLVDGFRWITDAPAAAETRALLP
jgi:hypothetical protein